MASQKGVLCVVEDHGMTLFSVFPQHDCAGEYPQNVEDIREKEYPTLRDTTYLDHAGTTPYPSSLITRYSQDLLANIYGNPHSASSCSQLSSRTIDDVRHDALRFFNADPNDFDLVFVSNATAGMKLVMDAFREEKGGFWYGYHRDAHTSLVGVREVAKAGSRCFESDKEVDTWLDDQQARKEEENEEQLQLFAYPAQSNMNGRRLPLEWSRRVRGSNKMNGVQRHYTLLDAAALVSTSPLDLSDKDAAPDFTVLSFYKIFGFPDLGGLIVRKASADILRRRAYFGGGTVDMVVCIKENWHAKKTESVHEAVEDGTLPYHNIIALKHAMAVHTELYGSMERISRHVAGLANTMHIQLAALRHGNGTSVCEIYRDALCDYQNTQSQGPIVAFNIRNARGAYVSNTEVEKLATIRNVQLRTGGLCNPGGLTNALGLAPWEMRENFSAGQRCGGENDIINNKPTGMIRISLGAMSTQKDVQNIIYFVEEFFVDHTVTPAQDVDILVQSMKPGELYIESLTVYPIKSCAGWKVPQCQSWDIRKEGLAWDREWCLVHQGTGASLSQKRFPRMAMLRPRLDLIKGALCVCFAGHLPNDVPQEVTVPLSADPRVFEDGIREQSSMVCGDKIMAKAYTSPTLAAFFTAALGVPCTLARFPAHGSGPSMRHAKAHLKSTSINRSVLPRPILLSNESPILVISRSSLNRLSEHVKANGGRAPQAEVFRANIVVAQSLGSLPGTEQPYAEDEWTSLEVDGGREGTTLRMLGPCRRCQMVCIDQDSGDREVSGEPFVTLTKTRRWEGKVWFGVHACLDEAAGCGSIRIGDKVNATVPNKKQLVTMPGDWPEECRIA